MLINDEIDWVKTQILHCEHTIEFLKKKSVMLNQELERLVEQKEKNENQGGN